MTDLYEALRAAIAPDGRVRLTLPLLTAMREESERRERGEAGWRERAEAAERELSEAHGLPPTIGPAPGETKRIMAALRERALAAEGALTVRLAVRREIEEALGMVPGLTDEQALQRGLDAVRALRERAETAERERDEARSELEGAEREADSQRELRKRAEVDRDAAHERARVAERDLAEARAEERAAKASLALRVELRREIDDALCAAPGITEEQALRRLLQEIGTIGALRERVKTAEREREELRRELLDLDLVLPATCGSRLDAARQAADDAARWDRALTEMRADRDSWRQQCEDTRSDALRYGCERDDLTAHARACLDPEIVSRDPAHARLAALVERIEGGK